MMIILIIDESLYCYYYFQLLVKLLSLLNC